MALLLRQCIKGNEYSVVGSKDRQRRVTYRGSVVVNGRELWLVQPVRWAVKKRRSKKR